MAMLARVLFIQELADRLRGTGVVMNAAPGPVQAHGSLHDVGGPFRWMMSTFGSSAEKAAGSVIWLVSSAEAGAVSGSFWAKQKQLPTPGMGSDPEAGKRLWYECERLSKPL
ncbi:hypothetical protein QFZ30_001430 [Arthrobacter pascens]|uniref:hypothetical protein n=1 Tax=Arthrobacter pascens TaxID=1677 RepID=UPI00278F0DC7|nr:hypothetical protein [Arthrobacter pascens]MDQ0678048.1 hypothetical protein [Arthrobacter pascens]